MTERYDVGVVGYGACSAVLVNLLLQRGLSVVVFEKDAEVLAIPRAAHFDDETLRSFQALGAADDLAASFTTSADYSIYNVHDQKVWGLNEFTQVATDQGWLSDYFFFQPDFEHYLRDKAIAQGVEQKLSCEVTDFVETEDDVVVSYTARGCPGGGQPERVSVRYLVGADGANSFVRRKLGIGMESLAASQRWLIVDIRVHDDVDVALSDGCWTKVGKDATITFVPMPKNMKRFELSMRPEQTDEEVGSKKAVDEFLARWFSPSDYDVLRANVYHFHALVAKSWRSGRCFIAGDAAHLMPPFLGQGVCTAIRDAMNLAWKLARVVKGQSPDTLLDTYDTERRPHARVFVNAAGAVGEKLSWMANATDDDMAAMESEDHGALRPPLGLGVHRSHDHHAGLLGPQPRLSDGRLLDYRTGYDFALVGDPGLIDGLSTSTRARLEALGTTLVPDKGEPVRTAISAVGGKAMLLRPDRYLVGTAEDSVGVDALVDELVGMLLEGAPA